MLSVSQCRRRAWLETSVLPFLAARRTLHIKRLYLSLWVGSTRVAVAIRRKEDVRRTLEVCRAFRSWRNVCSQDRSARAFAKRLLLRTGLQQWRRSLRNRYRLRYAEQLLSERSRTNWMRAAFRPWVQAVMRFHKVRGFISRDCYGFAYTHYMSIDI